MKIMFSHMGLYKKNGWGRTFELAKGLVTLGNNVTILCSSTGKNKIYEQFYEYGVKIIVFYDFIPRGVLGSGYGILSLISRFFYAMSHKFDIVHSDSHRDAAYMPCIINKFFFGSKLFIEWWDNFEEKVKISDKKRWYRFFLDNREIKREISTKVKSDGCIVLSKLLKQRAIKIGVKEENILLLHGGCDVDNIQNLLSIDVKRQNNIDVNEVTFGFIGMGDGEFSDLKCFFEALSELPSSVNVKFLNFGRSLEKTIKQMPNLKSRVIECGWIDFYRDSSKLSAVDVFVLTKEDDIINNSGWPTKFGDYLACGRPILLNPYGELLDFIVKNQPSLICVNNEKESIKAQILNVCENKYDLLGMGANNRKIAEQNSWLEKSRELYSFYKQNI